MTAPQLARPAWQSQGSLRPATDIQPQVGIYYDAVGNPHQAYLPAYVNASGQPSAPPGSVAPSSFVAVTPSDSVAQPAMQGLYFATAQTTLSVKGLGNSTAVAMGPQAQGTILRGQFGFVMATGTSPGTGIVAVT